MSRPPRYAWLLAWLLCFVPRAAALAALWPNVTVNTSSVAFGGTTLLSDLDTPMWPPAYGAFAEAVWTVVQPHWFLYMLLHAAVHALCGVFALSICRSLHLNARAQWLAVAAVAVLPYYVFVSISQIDVGVLVTVAAAFAAMSARWLISTRRGDVLATAAVAMLLFLTRANALSMIVAVYAVLMAIAPQQRARLIASATVFAAMLTLWSAVNLERFGVFTPMPANVGSNLWVGNHPGVAEELAGRALNPTDVGGPPAPGDPYYDADHVMSSEARRYMADHPAETLANAVRKAARYWDWRLDELNPHSRLQEAAYTLPFLVMIACALIGARELWRRNRPALAVLAAVILGYMAPHLMAYGMIRHRMSVEWAVLIVAAVGADALLRATGLARTTSTAYSLHRPTSHD